MSELTGFDGLRAAADATALADVRVTPELRARLLSRIRTLEQQGGGEEPAPEDRPPVELPAQPVRRVPTWLAGGAWTLAAAAVIMLAVRVGGGAPAPAAAVQDSGPQLPPPVAYSFPRAGASSGQANPPVVDLQDQGGSVALVTTPTRLNGNGQAITVTMDDAGGNGVTSSQSFSTVGTPNKVVVSVGTEYATLDQYGSAMVSLAVAEAQPGHKVVVNAEYGIRVTDAAAAVRRLHEVTLATGGYVAEETLDQSSDGGWSGRLSLRIPTDRFPGAVQQLDGIGKVEHQRQWTQDVTDHYMDLENRVAIQKEQEQRLRELATKAATFDDWNRLTQQINAVRVQIENMTGQLKLLTNQVEYALLQVQVLQPPPNVVHTETGAITLPQRAGQALINSLRHLGALSGGAVVGMVGLTPYLLLLAIPAGLLGWAWRRRRRRMLP